MRQVIVRVIERAAMAVLVAAATILNTSLVNAEKGAPRMTYLFDVELKYAEGVQCAPLGEPQGRPIGGGTGTVNGARIKGKVVRWSNFERTLAEGVCALQIPAEIRTDDDAESKFEALGHTLVPDKAQPSRWINAMTLRFQTDDARYRWLNTTLAVWEGEFDMQTLTSTGRVYAREDGTSAAR